MMSLADVTVCRLLCGEYLASANGETSHVLWYPCLYPTALWQLRGCLSMISVYWCIAYFGIQLCALHWEVLNSGKIWLARLPHPFASPNHPAFRWDNQLSISSYRGSLATALFILHMWYILRSVHVREAGFCSGCPVYIGRFHCAMLCEDTEEEHIHLLLLFASNKVNSTAWPCSSSNARFCFHSLIQLECVYVGPIFISCTCKWDQL